MSAPLPSKPTTPAASAGSPKVTPALPISATTRLPGLGILEEDDEFEDFPVEDWEENDQARDDVHAWEDNWDDDDVNDEFSKQLRVEFQKMQQAGHTVMSNSGSGSGPMQTQSS